MSAKKKVLAAASYVLVAALAVGGTVAYFTDKEDAVNVMTMGAGVDIELIEQQRSEDGSKLVDFVQGTQLMPAVGSAQGAKDNWGMSSDIENYVDKIVTVDNTGVTDAYVRVLVAVPAALDNTTNAGENVLHWNLGNNFDADGEAALGLTSDEYKKAVDWKYTETETIKVDGVGNIECNLYSFTYTDAVKAGTSTELASMVGFYLDSAVDYDDETGKYMIGDEVIDYAYDEVYIPVYAQAVQTAGFTSAAAAFDAADMPTNPWTGVLDVPAVAYSADELSGALTPGADVVIGGTVNAEAPELFAPGLSDSTTDFVMTGGGTLAGGTIVADGVQNYGLIVNAEDKWPTADVVAKEAVVDGVTVEASNAVNVAIYTQACSQPVTLNNVTVKNTSGTGINAEYGTTYLNDCTVTGDTDNAKDWLNTAVAASVSNDVPSHIVINGGTYTGKYAAYVWSTGGKIVINDGTFKGELKADAGSIEINGGTFTVNPEGIANVTVNGNVTDNVNGTWTVK